MGQNQLNSLIQSYT